MLRLFLFAFGVSKMENSESERKWTHEQKKRLLNTRLRNEGELCAKRKKRSVLWEKVLREIKEVDSDFPFSRDDITRKFLNFTVTYKRIKKRNNTSGEAATTWEFFDEMDEVYCCRSDVVVPEGNLECSLIEILSGTNENSEYEKEPDTSSPEPKAKKMKNEVLEFLQKEADSDKETLKNFMDLEERKLEVEKEKLEEMRNLRFLLGGLVNNK
ncbi:uncharacterized protein LOC118743625 [Rhagoletis pomonella]|uniref:uncharacterized protein LOC118743625 n=1 Tax=Rhagoletis pomonella TaxID=28610 RepID=UPI00177BBBDE|nr:uncharacterized protein LOC118743625 [Rhagoletis pomonella]